MSKKYITKGETGDHFFYLNKQNEFSCMEIDPKMKIYLSHNNTYYKGYNIGHMYTESVYIDVLKNKRELLDAIDRIESSPILRKLYKR